MRYTVIGAGGMGIQFGVLLQENAGCDVDFIDGWSENIEAIRAQNGAYVSQDGQPATPMGGSCSSNNISWRGCSNGVRRCSAATRPCSPQ